MAEGVRFVCGSCSTMVEAWSDGNPYYLDPSGAKVYAYHPDHEALEKCVGNDAPHLCLACGAEGLVDTRAPSDRCTECGSAQLVDAFELDGRACPACGDGTFARDPEFYAIS